MPELSHIRFRKLSIKHNQISFRASNSSHPNLNSIFIIIPEVRLDKGLCYRINEAFLLDMVLIDFNNRLSHELHREFEKISREFRKRIQLRDRTQSLLEVSS